MVLIKFISQYTYLLILCWFQKLFYVFKVIPSPVNIDFYLLFKLYTHYLKTISWLKINLQVNVTEINLFLGIYVFFLEVYNFFFINFYVILLYLKINGTYLSSFCSNTSLKSLKKKNSLKVLSRLVNFSETKFPWKVRFFSRQYFNSNITFKPTNMLYYLGNESFLKLNVNYLRKNKIFNKGRYSRNRQYYRTGVYWCLYINIIAVVGIYFWFYRFMMNYGYLWWLLFLFMGSFFWSKFILHNESYFILDGIFVDILWFLEVLKSFWSSFQKKVNYILTFIYLNELVTFKYLKEKVFLFLF